MKTRFHKKSHLGKSKIELTAGMHLLEIILTFQTACATNLDLTFGVGFYPPNIFTRSKSRLHKRVQKNVDLGGRGTKKRSSINMLLWFKQTTSSECMDNSRQFHKKNTLFQSSQSTSLTQGMRKFPPEFNWSSEGTNPSTNTNGIWMLDTTEK